VVAIYSTFLQRAFDQIVHDVCLPNLPVVFAIDRGGLVGEDGPTHHGLFDITYLRSLPNMTFMAPKDENELRHMLYTALQHDGPVAIRYPRGAALGVAMDQQYTAIPLGEAETLKQGKDLVILALGSMTAPAVEAAERLKEDGISASVINCRFVKPLDKRIAEAAAVTGRILVVEENTRQGGLGGAVLELLSDHDVRDVRISRLGLPDKFVGHGPLSVLRKDCGLDAEGIFAEAKKLKEQD
jgi:1-deoxy-D-xylulose-5-phosphate synthase